MNIILIIFSREIYLMFAIVQLIQAPFSLFSLCIHVCKATMVHDGNKDVKKNVHGAIEQ